MTNVVRFDGSIPQNYEDYLTAFLFDDFAEDIVKRISLTGIHQVLELAAGTGAVTRRLMQHLPKETLLTATDLQQDMLDVAKKSTTAQNIRWATADMTAIPYEDNQFDAIICQFGLMLVPAKLKALQEMHRVLTPGGQLLFSVWGDLAANTVWKITSDVVGSFLPIDPILQDPGPFSMNEPLTLQLLEEAGFSNIKTITLNKTGTIDSAAIAAKGLIEGLPVALAIQKTDPSLLPKIVSSLEEQLKRSLGDHPLHSPLQALVFETSKPK